MTICHWKLNSRTTSYVYHRQLHRDDRVNLFTTSPLPIAVLSRSSPHSHCHCPRLHQLPPISSIQCPYFGHVTCIKSVINHIRMSMWLFTCSRSKIQIKLLNARGKTDGLSKWLQRSNGFNTQTLVYYFNTKLVSHFSLYCWLCM